MLLGSRVGRYRRPWPDSCATKIKVDFSSREDGGSEAEPSWRAQQIGLTPILWWEMAAGPAWKSAMEDRIALDLRGSQPTLRATGKSSQDQSVILTRNFLIREVFSYER